MLGSIGSQDGDVVQSLRKQLDEAQRLLAQKDGEVKDMEAKMFEQKSRLREQQRALKAEWERFKAAQIQMASKAEAEFNAAVQEIGAGLGSAAASAAEGER